MQVCSLIKETIIYLEIILMSCHKLYCSNLGMVYNGVLVHEMVIKLLMERCHLDYEQVNNPSLKEFTAWCFDVHHLYVYYRQNNFHK